MKVDKVIQKVVEILYQEQASSWSIHDKGALLAAVKLQLQDEPEKAKGE